LSRIKKKGDGKLKKCTKARQIAVRFDDPSYEKILECAKAEHRGLGELVRHAVLVYVEQSEKEKKISAAA